MAKDAAGEGKDVGLMFAVRDWLELYENAETKKRLNLGWVLVPNRHDSLAFCRLMAKGEQGLIIFGVWNLVLQLASRGKQSRRGLLCSDCGEAYTAEDIAVKTRAPVDAIAPALIELVKLGWLIEIDQSGFHDDSPELHSGLPSDDAKQVSKKVSKKVSKPPRHGGEIEIPKNLKTKAFMEQWETWKGHLKAKGRPSVETLRAHLIDLAKQPRYAVERLSVGIDLGLRAPASQGFGSVNKTDEVIPVGELKRKIEEV